jgi:hypothetical protein
MMRWDALTGDYGMGFYGHAIAAGSYLVNDPTFGWLSFGGDLKREDSAVTITPRDGARRRLFIAPAGLWITLEAGHIASARYTLADGAITLTLDPATPGEQAARLFVESTAPGAAHYTAPARWSGAATPWRWAPGRPCCGSPDKFARYVDGGSETGKIPAY